MVKVFESSDFEMIDSWFFERTKCHLDKDLLSKNGFIIPNAAVGFLYLTNSKLAHVDFMITNPDASQKFRHEALQLICEKIISYAKELHIKMILVNTKVGFMKELAIKNDFDYTGIHSSFSRRI